MKCRKCKTGNADDSQFCRKCGTALTDIPATLTSPPLEIEEEPKKSALYFALGENDEGFKCLEKAYKEHDFFIKRLKVTPQFDSVRKDQRFKALLKKINLE